MRSTGIYCRPFCPARRPHREQVAFFRLPQEASAAGFRACRRCHPEQAHLPEPQAELVEQVCRYIATHLDAPLYLSDLSQQFYLSPYHLQRTFKRIKSITPRQYVESCRLEQFKARLHDGETVTGALYDAGYQSSSSLYQRTPVQLGMTPTAYRKGGKGMRIGYSIVLSHRGYVLVAATMPQRRSRCRRKRSRSLSGSEWSDPSSPYLSTQKAGTSFPAFLFFGFAK